MSETQLDKLNLSPSTAGEASLALGVGVTVTSPNDGEMWNTSAGFFIHSNGQTIQLAAGLAVKPFTATLNQTAFTLDHPVVADNATSIIVFYDQLADNSWVLQEPGICSSVSGTSLTVISGLAAGSKILLIYPRAT